MSARKIDGWWYADFRVLGERYRKRSPANTRAEAQRFEQFLRKEIALHGSLKHLEPKDPDEEKAKTTFAEFATKWLREYVDIYNKWSERASKRSKLNHRLLPSFGHLPLSEITTSRIDQFSANMVREGLTAKSVNNHLTVLRKCLVKAEEWGELNSVPRFKFLRTQAPEVDARTADEVAALLAACPPIPWRAFVLTKVRTGLRFSEIVALHWQDVDLDSALLTVRRGEWNGHMDAPKTRRSVRTIPLTSEVVEALRALPHDGDRVFTCHGRRITYWNAWYHLNKACKRAGVRHTSWHPLRHTFATELFARRAHPKAVQDLMGHEKIEMTMRYTHLSAEVLRGTIQLLEGPPSQVWAAGGQRSQAAPGDTPKTPAIAGVSDGSP